MRTLWVILAWCLLFGAGTSSRGLAGPAPRGDGSEADTSIDRLIRGNPDLAGLERQLAATYGAAMAVHQETGNANRARRLEESQGQWEAELDECVSTANPVDCVRNRYELRVARLQVEYGMVPVDRRVLYVCEGEHGLEVTYFATDHPTVRLARGNRSVIASLFRLRSGARYLAENGVTFWTEGDEAVLEWTRGKAFRCQVNDAG